MVARYSPWRLLSPYVVRLRFGIDATSFRSAFGIIRESEAVAVLIGRDRRCEFVWSWLPRWYHMRLYRRICTTNASTGGRLFMIQAINTHLRTCVLLLFAVAAIGCEGAGAPLGEPDELTVDKTVTGTWYAAGDDEEAQWLRVWAFNENEYYVEWETEDDEDEVARLRVFSSDLDTYVFSNVQCVGCNEEDRAEWFLYQYELESPDVLLIRSIRETHYSEALSQMTRSRDVRSYVEQHMDEPGFFSDNVLRMLRHVPADATD